MINLKIKQEIDENLFLVAPYGDEKETNAVEITFGVAHDYVLIQGFTNLHNDNGTVSDLKVKVGIQIPIRPFIKTIIPSLSKYQYLKEDHLFPRFSLKGEKYEPYAYYKSIIFLYDEEKKKQMVHIYTEKEKDPIVVTKEFYEQFIKGNI